MVEHGDQPWERLSLDRGRADPEPPHGDVVRGDPTLTRGHRFPTQDDMTAYLVDNDQSAGAFAGPAW